MGLNAALNIGQSALSASSLGIQIAGNNIANVSTPGYSRQLARLVPLRGDSQSWNVGSGVGIAGVDMIRSRRGPLVLEVNSTPGLEGIESVSGGDVAGRMIDYVVNLRR